MSNLTNMNFKEYYFLRENNLEELYKALESLNIRNSYEDSQVLPRNIPNMEDLWLVGQTKGMYIYLDKENISNSGPHNFSFFNNDDEYIGSCNLGKNGYNVTINTIGFIETARGWGFGMEFYEWLLKDKGYNIISDKEMSDGAVSIYKKLFSKHKAGVLENGRVIIYTQKSV